MNEKWTSFHIANICLNLKKNDEEIPIWISEQKQ